MEEKEKNLNVEQLKKKNHNQKIAIIALSVLLIGSLILQIPTVRKQLKTAINGGETTQSQKKKVDYNSKYKLNLTSVYGDVEAYHPKIVSFDKKWNGYLYWMSYTPYPDSDEQKENPHIVGSNDLINWEVPKGLVNPLDDVEGDNHKQYNSDSHLVYVKDTDTLECYWRYVNDEDGSVTIYERTTKNGKDWTEKEIASYAKSRKQKDWVAPAIIYEDGIYKIWYVDHDLVVRYAEAKPGDKNWTDVKQIDLEYPKQLKPWHLDVIKTDNGYEMLLMAFENWDKRGVASLYHTSSTDNKTWKKCKEIIKPTTKTNYWDNRGIYRSSMIKKDGIYYVLYSASDKNNIKGIGIMYGKDIRKLKSVGIDYSNDKDAVKKFNKLIKKEKSK